MKRLGTVSFRRTIVGLAGLASLAVAACGNGPAASDPGLFFPTRDAEQGGASMTALFQGPLVVKDGCVVIGQPGDYSLPVWWKGFTAVPDDQGRVMVRDADGAVVAVEGETFEMGGGYTAEFRPADKVEPAEEQVARVEEWLGYAIPNRCLSAEVYGIWVVGETQPLQASSPVGS
jgi:hypothetical protein